MSLRSSILQIVLNVADLLGVNNIFRRINAGKVRLLMYHGVSSATPPTPYWTLLPADKFRRQMEYLKRYCEVVPATYVIDGSSGRSAPRCPVVITFDDGLVNTYAEAWPVLRELRLPAICFVLPGLSESGHLVWTDRLYACFMAAPEMELDLSEFGLGRFKVSGSRRERARQHKELARQLKAWAHAKRERLLSHLFSSCTQDIEDVSTPFRLMTKDQVMELGRSAEFSIGAHTCHHVILSTLTPDEQAEEIQASIRLVSEWCANSVPIFCYPNGQPEDFDDTTTAILKRAGVKAALSTSGGFHKDGDDMYRIKRIPIGSDISDAEFKARLSGLYQFLTSAAGRPYS